MQSNVAPLEINTTSVRGSHLQVRHADSDMIFLTLLRYTWRAQKNSL